MLDRIVAKTFTFAYGALAFVAAGFLAIRYGEAKSKDEQDAIQKCKPFFLSQAFLSYP